MKLYVLQTIFVEEIILGEDRTTEEERMHIMEGWFEKKIMFCSTTKKIYTILNTLIARRKAAAKRNKLKNLGKSKSTDTEDEDASEECTEDGNDYRD